MRGEVIIRGSAFARLHLALNEPQEKKHTKNKKNRQLPRLEFGLIS